MGAAHPFTRVRLRVQANATHHLRGRRRRRKKHCAASSDSKRIGKFARKAYLRGTFMIRPGSYIHRESKARRSTCQSIFSHRLSHIPARCEGSLQSEVRSEGTSLPLFSALTSALNLSDTLPSPRGPFPTHKPLVCPPHPPSCLLHLLLNPPKPASAHLIGPRSRGSCPCL